MAIHKLSRQLANQIAAGEVVERPASVVKELVENSLDAGANQITIDIEQGGSGLIRVRDNGCGIDKQDLELALARHATSKISQLADLDEIVSLGFRGEALASISSVARLTLTARTAEQNQAWQAYAEGQEMAVTIKPAAHPLGCTVEVANLFYNTPARRKFLRSEKTEFAHIDEVVRRIALSRFDCQFTLSHNGKLLRQYQAVKDNASPAKRLAAICGSSFSQQAVQLAWQQGDLQLHGYFMPPALAQGSLTELHYFYVNGRMMRDRVISHAIRQAFANQLTGETLPAYVLFLQINPQQVDVNVHPAKHEVRFHQARLVHDFICQGISSALAQLNELPLVASQSAASTPLSTLAATETIAAMPQPVTTVNHSAARSVTASLPTSKDTGAVHHQGARAGYAPPAKAKVEKQQLAYYQQLLAPNSLAEPSPSPLANNPPEAQNDELLPAIAGLGKVLAFIDPHYVVVQRQQQLALLSLPQAQCYLYRAQLNAETQTAGQPLLIPVRIALNSQELQQLTEQQTLFNQLGFQWQCHEQHCILRAVPAPLRQRNLSQLLVDLLAQLDSIAHLSATEKRSQLIGYLASQLATQALNYSLAGVIQLLADLERLYPDWLQQIPADLLQPIALDNAISQLEQPN